MGTLLVIIENWKPLMDSEWTFLVFQKFKLHNFGFQQEIRDKGFQVYSGMKEFCES